MAQLKPLEQHNAERRAERAKARPRPSLPTGIECPQCGKELHDVSADPPYRNETHKAVHCPACRFEGRREI